MGLLLRLKEGAASADAGRNDDDNERKSVKIAMKPPEQIRDAASGMSGMHAQTQYTVYTYSIKGLSQIYLESMALSQHALAGFVRLLLCR